jgi:hypothetical protein
VLSGTPSVVTSDTFTVEVTSGDGQTATRALAIGVNTNAGQLIHHYPFAGDASDVVGGADGALVGGAGVSGGILTLDGSTGYLQMPGKVVPTAGSYTVALFVRLDVPHPQHVEFISQGCSSCPGFYIGLDPGGLSRVTDDWRPATVSPTDGAFHHYALTVDADGGQSFLYLDGVLEATTNSALTTTTLGTDTRLGRQFEPFNEFLDGDLDEVRIYVGVLSAAEVAGLAAGITIGP